MSFELNSIQLFEVIEIGIASILSFSLGLNINGGDIYKPIYHSINKTYLYFTLLSCFVLTSFLVITNLSEIYFPILLIASFFLNIWPVNGQYLIRKTTLNSYSNLFFLYLLIAFAFIDVFSTSDYKLPAINFVVFVVQTLLIGNLLIWVINRFLYRSLRASMVFLFIVMLIIYKINSDLFLYSNIIATIWFGYNVRNTVFSTAYRKNINYILAKDYLILVATLVCTIVLLPNLIISEYTITILSSFAFCFLLIVVNKKVFVGKYFASVLLSIICLSKSSLPTEDTLFYNQILIFLLILSLSNYVLFTLNKSKFEIYVNKENSVEKESDKSNSKLFVDFIENPIGSRLQDFSFAGFNYKGDVSLTNLKNLREYNVSEFGIKPNLNIDSTRDIQSLVNDIGQKGGGVLFFPAGKYNLNADKHQMNFLEINYSNIILKGEIINASNKTVFVSHNHTLIGSKNPWLSPFLITYGTRLQKTNLFWGLQFKNKKQVKTRSNSLTDPGSDGVIQSPEFATNITCDSYKGDTILKVSDSSTLIDTKCILIGMYNTTEDGNLIKLLLNRDVLPDEWQTAHRAGPEKAPSFQWLVEIDEIIDQNTIRLKQPLRRDIITEFEPEVYCVPMIENVGIQDITFDCKWDGVFRHHGAPIYFSTKQSQIMDYGWNAVNFCRVSHGFMRNVEILNFTNPIYVQDSRNVTIENVNVSGHDGHQGIKLYGHSCDNLMRNITFSNHYADMIGGEGNCYGNVFTEISYVNSENKPVDFDFHGFSEGPFSPPSYTLFDNCHGFRGIKASGTLFNQPACALDNVWWNISSEGFEGSTEIFKHDQYKFKSKIRVNLSAMYRATIYCLQRSLFDFKTFAYAFSLKKEDLIKTGLIREKHFTIFKNSIIIGYRNPNNVTIGGRKHDYSNESVFIENLNKVKSVPVSLYKEQLRLRTENLIL
ncbi:hypothetical protein VB776_16645 [Arcicella sp. DC2W]|uniref:Pectate lyase superfamily protein domain-containing protein n=1 Tax=Arcicella gelida TaxID=2984195 RepID=A0ABU5S7W1_9BACT|nr:hypothetical protein [Arcicella sp. DC2W]MEA5404563.1 hypothetical protein [Arcicella sp. DC2W]